MAEEFGPLVGSIDQGSSSTRFSVFSSKTGEPIAFHQEESEVLNPQKRWVEMDANWLVESVRDCIEKTVEKLGRLGLGVEHIKSVGITNQMLTSIFWDKYTGKPLHNAIVYTDVRAYERYEQYLEEIPKEKLDSFRKKTGMPFTANFLPVKLPWILEHDPTIKQAYSEGRLMVGTVNTWILWSLTGGADGGKYITDVTNACHTGLFNVHSLTWDKEIACTFDVPLSLLPDISSTSEIYGYFHEGPLKGIPLSGMVGDQPSATIGNLCFKPGESKCTYGTVASLNLNTGIKVVHSNHGLLTSPLYQFGKGNPAVYTLEAVVLSGGNVVKWIRDNLGFITNASDIEKLAGAVEDTDDCYFVPAMEGFFCPYWTEEARGIICGLNCNTTREHICRAALESICFQIREVLDIAAEESGFSLPSLKADGGMTVNNLLMQIQADILGENVVRPSMKETTSLGAALVAGAAEGVDIFKVTDDRLRLDVCFSQKCDVFKQAISKEVLENRLKRWKKALEKSFNWLNS